MQVSEKTLDEINVKSFSLTSRNAVVGLDGFVDKIVAPVKKRHGLGDQFDPIETITEMGEKITAAAGKSANIELFPRFEKLGGNGLIMANAMLSLGMNVRYIGALGSPNINPVFDEFARKTSAISLCEPCNHHCIGIQGRKGYARQHTELGKYKLCKNDRTMWRRRIFRSLSKADLISIVNWTMIPKMTALLVELVEKVLPNLLLVIPVPSFLI